MHTEVRESWTSQATESETSQVQSLDIKKLYFQGFMLSSNSNAVFTTEVDARQQQDLQEKPPNPVFLMTIFPQSLWSEQQLPLDYIHQCTKFTTETPAARFAHAGDAVMMQSHSEEAH